MVSKKSRLSLTSEEILELYKSLGLGSVEERSELLQHILFSPDEPKTCEIPRLTLSDRTTPLNAS